MDTLYIVMPAYNEEENIEDVVLSWYSMLAGKSSLSRLVIADSGSMDKTRDILENLKKRYPQIEILSTQNKQHGPKCIALYKYAAAKGADWIFQTDSDGQTNADEFAQFWDLRDDYSVILGNRTSREDGRGRVFVERVVCILLKIYFNVNIPDANAPFRLMKTATVCKYINKLPDDYNLPNIMMTTYFVYFREKVKFINITFKKRGGGVNSIDLRKIVKIGWNALHDFHVLKKDMVGY